MLTTIITLHLATAFVIAFFMPLSAALRWPLWAIRLHARWRVPVMGTLALTSALTGIAADMATAQLTAWVFLQLVLLLIGWNVHASRLFKAVDYPALASPQLLDKLTTDTRMIVVSLGEKRRAYPLNFVAQHHVVNDKLGEKEIAVTFCPMCHTSITFGTTGLGPLVVATLYSGNMVFSDVTTNTWWQQATGESIAGQLHPRSLEMLFAEVMPWAEVKRRYGDIEVTAFAPKELLPFSLPIPGLMRKVLASQFVPGLRSAEMDKRLPARELVIGVDTVDGAVAWRVTDLAATGWVADTETKLLVRYRNGAATAFYVPEMNTIAEMKIDDHEIRNLATGKRWDLRGSPVTGATEPLERVQVSEEYWFGWARFHPRSRLTGVEPRVNLY